MSPTPADVSYEVIKASPVYFTCPAVVPSGPYSNETEASCPKIPARCASTVASNEPSMLIVASLNPTTYERVLDPNEVVSKVSISRGNVTEFSVSLMLVRVPPELSTLNEALERLRVWEQEQANKKR